MSIERFLGKLLVIVSTIAITTFGVACSIEYRPRSSEESNLTSTEEPTLETTKERTEEEKTTKGENEPVEVENIWQIIPLALVEEDIENEPGWKRLTVQVTFENCTDEFREFHPEDYCVNGAYYLGGLPVRIATSEGYEYEGTLQYPDPKGPIPGRFRVTGGAEEIWYFGNTKYEMELFTMDCKVAKDTSGYSIVIEGFPAIQLENSIQENLVFPTDLPNSSFSNVGDILTVSDKGDIAILDFGNEPNVYYNEHGVDRLFITILYKNASGGYDQYFNLYYYVIGSDGVKNYEYEHLEREFRDSSIAVGPSEERSVKHVFLVPEKVSNLKLVIFGDIQAVINLS
jgi:hypothetical protein